jgi:hypothetical protein
MRHAGGVLLARGILFKMPEKVGILGLFSLVGNVDIP